MSGTEKAYEIWNLLDHSVPGKDLILPASPEKGTCRYPLWSNRERVSPWGHELILKRKFLVLSSNPKTYE